MCNLDFKLLEALIFERKAKTFSLAKNKLLGLSTRICFEIMFLVSNIFGSKSAKFKENA